MRRTLNLNVSVELCDNDNLTMTVREAAGSLCETGEGDDGVEDTVVYMATLPYDPTLETSRSFVSLIEYIDENMARWLDKARESIALDQEQWAKTAPSIKRAFQKQAGPEWACPECGVVNCDAVCEDCGRPSPYIVKGDAS